MLIISVCSICGCTQIQIGKEVSFSYEFSSSEENEEETTSVSEETEVTEESSVEVLIDEDSVYTSCEDVSLYIYTYGHLPSNFMTKEVYSSLQFFIGVKIPTSRQLSKWIASPGRTLADCN